MGEEGKDGCTAVWAAGVALKDSVRPAPGSDLPMLYLPQQRVVPRVQVTPQNNSKNLEVYLRHSTSPSCQRWLEYLLSRVYDVFVTV